MERVKEAVELYLEVEGPVAEGRELVGIQFIEVVVREPKAAPSR
jgi:hypothetical protein